MQAVCDTLEQIVSEGTLKQYAIGGATAAGFHGEPLATRDVDVFVFLDAIPDSLLVSLESVFTRLSELGFNEFKEEGCSFMDFQFGSRVPLPVSRAKRLTRRWLLSGISTACESCAQNTLPQSP